MRSGLGARGSGSERCQRAADAGVHRLPSPEPEPRVPTASGPDNMPSFGGSMKTMSMRGLCVLALSVCAAAPALAQAPAAPPAGPRQLAGGQRRLAGDRRRSARHVPHLRAECAGDQARRGRHSRRRPDHAADQRRERRLAGHDRPDRSGRLSLQLQRRRRRDDRSAQPRDERVEHECLEPVLRVRLGLHGHARRAARSGRRSHVSLDGAEDVPPDARLHAAGLRDEERQVSGLLPAARRRRQRRCVVDRSAGRASSSTT